MKKYFLLIALLLTVVHSIAQQIDFSLAKVGEKVMGVYVFINCEPANEYDYIATINVRWHEGNPEKSFLEIIERGKKKYPNFNAVIFKDLKFEKADLIKFRDLEITGGGFRVGDYAVFNEYGKPQYGIVMQLDNPHKKAGIKYLDDYGEEKLNNIAYVKLSVITKEQYDIFIEQQSLDIKKHQFIINEKVSWTEGKKPAYGEVTSLNTKSHDAVIKVLNKYGEEKTITVDFLKLEKLEDQKFTELRQKELEEIKKHQFIVGEKISFVNEKVTKCAEVVSLNNKSHEAIVKYLGVFAEEKTATEDFFDMEKVSEEKYNSEIIKYKEDAKKYQFVAGEKVLWSKGSMLGIKNETINAEVLAIDDVEHKATIRYIKDGAEKQETVSLLNLTRIR